MKELCECGLRATSQGNEEDKISQRVSSECPLLFDTFLEGFLGDGGALCWEFWRNAFPWHSSTGWCRPGEELYISTRI